MSTDLIYGRPRTLRSRKRLHYVVFKSQSGELTFTCRGDETSSCHQYPNCECESWGDDHPHPNEPHQQCWAKNWFDNDGACYIGDDEDGNGKPTRSGRGYVTFSFDGDSVEWEWVAKS